MSFPWPVKDLIAVAKVRVSNIDKQSLPHEESVRLCNYLDVYENDRIVSGMDFMEATATRAEIERFALKEGDVVITKDSETPDDIGIPAVISENVQRLVCGYHLALIRPDLNEMDPEFLSKQLATHRIGRYFASLASGSTRYGLPISAIERVQIPVPHRTEQTKIAEVLAAVDRLIEQTEALITKQKHIKIGLAQDLLTRGIDKHGNLRSEATHQFKNSPLGRIPFEWGVYPISRFGSRSRPWLRSGPFGSDLNTKHWVTEGVPVLTIGSLGQGDITMSELLFVSAATANTMNGFRVMPGDIIFSRVADIGRSVVIREHQNGWIISSNLMRISLDTRNANPYFLYENIAFNSRVKAQLRAISNSGGRQIVNGAILGSLLFPWPDTEEQGRIVARLEANERHRRALDEQLTKQQLFKTALMQDLLTGNKRVTPLLEMKHAG